MKLANRVEIKLDNYEKCSVICDQDCPLGQLYDYACELKSFISQKIQEAEAQSQPESKVEEIAKA
jgi:hypothetical protein